MIFKKEYRGFLFDMWEKLQDLHDYEHNWSEKGLSSHGKLRFNELKECIKNNYSIPA